MTKVTASGSKTTTNIKMNHLTTRLTALSIASLIKIGFSVASAAATSESKARATNLKDPMSVARILPSRLKICCSASSFFAKSSPFLASSSAELSGPKTDSVSLKAVSFRLASAISVSSFAILESAPARATWRVSSAVLMLSACSAPPVVNPVILRLASDTSF